jgi:hypothetical protein
MDQGCETLGEASARIHESMYKHHIRVVAYGHHKWHIDVELEI